MIKIERNKLDDIASEYLTKLQDEKGYNKKKDNVIHNHWIDNRARIIKSKNFNAIINEFNALNQDGFKAFKEYMIGQYEELFYNRKFGKWLAKKLDVRTCPYCNRQYTFTVEVGTRDIRPEFDHFHSKSIYPYLALSFFNLIPACPTCNHIKSDYPIDKNPYFEGFEENFKFKIKTNEGEDFTLDWALRNNFVIEFTDSNRNIDVFALKELYNEHIDIVKEIIDKAQAYNQSYYDSLIDSYKGLGKQEADIERYVWGNYLENALHEKRPLSKLTKDILQQLGIK